jgi:hypothetical protein
MTRTLLLLAACASGLLLAACSKDPFSRTISQITNRSSHNVRLLPFVGDSAYAHLAVSVTSGDSLEVYNASAPGKESNSVWTDYLQQFDSVQVFYMDTATVTAHDTVHIAHVRSGVVPAYTRFIPYSSTRSLYNIGSWVSEPLEESRHMLKSRFTYSFTEADYQAAR